MHTRKVQQLGPSTLAVTLPAEWARTYGVEKGDELPLQERGGGTITISPQSARDVTSTATVAVDDVGADAVERAIVGQYVLGRRVIHVESEDPLADAVITAVYEAESQLMGIGVIEEAPDRITIRCSANPEDFDLDTLLGRLENTGSTMRNEAVKSLLHDDAALAERALNRERQANKIFVLLLRLLFTAHQTPTLVSAVGLDDDFPLIGYRPVAKNLELTADNAQDVAEVVLDAEAGTLDLDETKRRRLPELADRIDDVTATAVQAVVERDYEKTVECRTRYADVTERQREIRADLPDVPDATLLAIWEILVSLQQTAEYAIRNAEIAANLALHEQARRTES